MAVNRYRVALNNARFPFLSQWAPRAVVLQSADTGARQPNAWQGSPENVDFNLAQVLYGENFVPVTNGLKSVSYTKNADGIAVTDFDQIFPLRDEDENTVLYSPGAGKNYVLDLGVWISHTVQSLAAGNGYTFNQDPALSRVTRAYVEGKTFVCYSRLTATNPVGPITRDGSLFSWDPALRRLRTHLVSPIRDIITNIPYAMGEIDGIASSNGYLLVWSGISVAWAPFDGAAFNYEVYANGEVTGAGSQIPEDIKGPITAITPVARGFIIWTTKNAVAAMYNANNFASPWIFAEIQNCGGVESFEQVTEGGNKGAVYAYTTGGLQLVTLNSAESVFPDATDFLGARIIERFNEESLEFEVGTMTLEMFVKVTMCSQRFLVISYGTYPGIFSFALVYDSVLERWGKLRIVHKDCFAYSYGVQPAELTYSMLGDVPYEVFDAIPYDEMSVSGSDLTYPRQSVAFMLENGEIDLAVMDERDPEGIYESFVLIGKNQFSRSRSVSLNAAEIEGTTSNAEVFVLRSVNGATFDEAVPGFLRESVQHYSEWGFDMPTGKTLTIGVKGQFHLSTLMLETQNEGVI